MRECSVVIGYASVPLPANCMRKSSPFLDPRSNDFKGRAQECVQIGRQKHEDDGLGYLFWGLCGLDQICIVEAWLDECLAVKFWVLGLRLLVLRYFYSAIDVLTTSIIIEIDTDITMLTFGCWHFDIPYILVTQVSIAATMEK